MRRLSRMTAAAALAAASLALPAATGSATAAPADVQPLLAAQLAAAAEDARLPVAVHGLNVSVATEAVTAAGLTRVATFNQVGVVLANGTPAQIEAVGQQAGVTYLEGDQQLEYTMDTSHIATRGIQARETFNDSAGRAIDGTGVSVAVIDSGIDGTHPFFKEADGSSAVVRNMKNVCPLLNPNATTESVCFQDVPSNDSDTPSNGGHGTHVAGTVAGNIITTTSPAGIVLQGAAPGAKLVGLSVGQTISVFAGSQGLNWVLDNHRAPCGAGVSAETCPPIKATNNSYGPPGGGNFDPNSASVKIQRMLVEQGVITVWAAGNDAGDGSGGTSDPNDAQSITQNTNPPGQDPTPGILMVASYNDGNSGNRDLDLSGFSSRGVKTLKGTYPDISAPGDTITSSCRLGSLPICQGDPSYDNGNYQTISGTSMATPHIAGIVAQIFQAGPTLTPAQVEDLLEDTAHKFGDQLSYEADEPARNDDDTTSFDKGHGLVDVAAAVAEIQNVAPPAAPGPLCGVTSLQVVDAANDANQVVLTGTPRMSDPSLDITKGFLTWDPTAQAVTVHLRVTDLAASPPPGALGEFFRYYFSVNGGPEYFLTANRRATVQTFTLRQQDPAKTVPLTGTFDNDMDEVRIVLPAAAFATAFPMASPIVSGASIGTNQVLGQRDTGSLTLTADTASGSCPFIVGVSQPAPGTQDPAPGGPDPIIPEVPLAVLLPLAGAAVAGGLLARRRRTVVRQAA